MSDVVGNPDDQFSYVTACILYTEFTNVYGFLVGLILSEYILHLLPFKQVNHPPFPLLATRKDLYKPISNVCIQNVYLHTQSAWISLFFFLLCLHGRSCFLNTLPYEPTILFLFFFPQFPTPFSHFATLQS